MDILLRKYPFPYQAALAINNDTDNMDWAAFEDWHAYTNGELGLEVSDSFWIWAADGSFALLHGTPWKRDARPSPETMRIAELAQAGWLDTLHGFGDWPVDYDLRQDDIAYGLDQLDRLKIRPPLYVNHGGGHLRGHNIGGTWSTYQGGDNPEHPSYCMPALRERGVKFFWTDALFENQRICFDIKDNSFSNSHERRWSTIADRTQGIRVATLPGATPAQNLEFGRHCHERLLVLCMGRDGSPFWGFKRYRGEEAPTVASLPLQLSATHLDELESRGAASIIYQHMGVWRALGRAKRHPSQRPSAVPVLDEGARWALRDLADRHHGGRILVSTCARLLNYLWMRDGLRFGSSQIEGKTIISIHGVQCPVEGFRSVQVPELAGIGFVVPNTTGEIIVRLDGCEVNLSVQRARNNLNDESDSVYFPWRPLEWIASKDLPTSRPPATTKAAPPVSYDAVEPNKRLSSAQCQTVLSLIHAFENDSKNLFSTIPKPLRAIKKEWSAIKAPALLRGADEYIKKMHAWPLEYYLERLKALTGGRGTILDAGCGTATWSIPMAALFDKVIAIDRNRSRVDMAQWLVQRAGCQNVVVEHGDITALKQAEETFDFVFCYGVAISYLSLRTVLHEFHRVMKPGATLYMCLNGRGWSKFLRDERSKQNRKHKVTGMRGLYNSICQSTHQELNNRLSRARLKLTDPTLQAKLAKALELSHSDLNDMLDALQAATSTTALEPRLIGTKDQAVTSSHLAGLLDTILDTADESGPQLTATLSEIRVECDDELWTLFGADLLGLFSGRKDTFSHNNAGREYKPDEASELCKQTGFTDFQWAREGELLLTKHAKKQEPVFLGDFGGDLAVWEFVAKR